MILSKQSKGLYIFESDMWLPSPKKEVFDFFTKVENLQQITPPWFSFTIITPLPLEIKQGTIIDYKLRRHSIPFSWKTEITLWKPPTRFVDSQLKGPYKSWVHTHTFKEEANGTHIQDRVEYTLPGGLLAPFIHWLFVKKDIEQIFNYRQNKLKDIFTLK